MNTDSNELLEQLDEFLGRSNQMWLLGAGISKDAGIPLMNALTNRVAKKLDDSTHKKLLDDLLAELPKNSHIEHVLSQLGDYAALAKRTASKSVSIGGQDYSEDQLDAAHSEVVGHIAETVRWGYREAVAPGDEEIGRYGTPIVDIDGHLKFVSALGKRQAGLEGRRRPLRIFTTNYDTLLEDALAISGYSYWDGFSGGAVAFRSHRYGLDDPDKGFGANLIKLHGSIDWYLGDDGKVWRVRDADKYPQKRGRVLIYPQSTKYVATQRDPFASQFDLFRSALSAPDSVLVIGGYSFGDDHINQEIEIALTAASSKLTLLAFVGEFDAIPDVLDRWRKLSCGKRVYIMTQHGLYCGNSIPEKYGAAGELDWWSFSGMIGVLLNGARSAIK